MISRSDASHLKLDKTIRRRRTGGRGTRDPELVYHVAASVASSNAQDSGVLATYYQVAVSCGAEQRGATALRCVNTHDMAVLQPRIDLSP